MHELAICRGIIEAVRSTADGFSSPLRISRVVVKIGRLTSVVPDSLQYYFGLLTPGTFLDGAVLLIEEVPVRAFCSDCETEFEIDEPSFACPNCGSGFIELRSGRELQLVSLETAEEEQARGN